MCKEGDTIYTLYISYKPGKKEVVDNLFGVYVNRKGKASCIRGSVYDKNSKRIIFNIDHFSVYGVGYFEGNKVNEKGDRKTKES